MTGRRSHGRLSALNGVVHQGNVALKVLPAASTEDRDRQPVTPPDALRPQPGSITLRDTMAGQNRNNRFILTTNARFSRVGKRGVNVSRSSVYTTNNSLPG